jgi:hypothetical protein
MSATREDRAPVDRRRRIYAVLDLCFVVFYLFLATSLIPATGGLGSAMQWLLVLAMAMAGAGMLMPNRKGWLLSASGCALLLLLELALLVLLLLSASYLAGVYGSFGRGASALALVVAALSLELVALLPAFQLKYLLTRAGRRAFAVTRS